MWEDLADTLEPVSATKPMPVNVITGGGGGAMTIADGDDVAEGATTDSAVTSDTDGTVIGFLRGLVKILASVWDSLNGRLKVDASAVAVPVTDNSGSLTVDDGGGSLTVDGPLTDAQLRATPVPVSGTVTITDGSGPVTVDGTVAATQSGTWTVQPGNTANTTAWKVDASSVAVPVTDNSGSLTVDDGGGSLTVDGPLTDAQLRAAVVPIGDGGGSLTVDGAVTVSGTATVSGTVSVDSITTSVTPGTGAAHLGKAEDAAHASGDTGVMALAVRRDADTSLSGTTGDYSPLQVDSYGNLKAVQRDQQNSLTITGAAQSVQLQSAGMGAMLLELSGTWVGTFECITFGPAFQTVNLSFKRVSDGAWVTTTTANGLYLVPTAGYVYVNFRCTVMVSGTATLNLNGSVASPPDILSLVPGTGATNLGKAEDAAHASGDTGVMALAVRNDTRGTLAGADMDYAPLQLNSSGDLRVDVTGGTATTSVVDLLGATDATRVLTILAANTSRRGATIRNDTDMALIIREGGSASATNYTDILPAGARYTLDFPASTSILTAYLPQVPQGRLIATERS